MASPSVELQTLIFERLTTDPTVTALIGNRVHDGLPEDEVFPFVSFGPSDWSPEDADCIAGRRETIQLDVWTRDNRRLWKAKEIADAVAGSLHSFDGELPTHALSDMEVTRVQVMPDPDGRTAHATVTLEAHVEVR